MTRYQDLQARLGRGEIIIVDGGTGTELQSRGVPMHGFAWSAAALDTHPETVLAVHEDYIRAGTDVLIANTYSTAPHVLERAGLGDRVRALNQRAVALAQEARENAAAGRPVAVAGSISSFRVSVTPVDQLEGSYREQADLLAEAGVDLIALEMMSGPERAAPAIRAALGTGLPIWIGFSCRVAEDGTVRFFDDSPFTTGLTEDLALLADLPTGDVAVTVMHTLTEETAPALEIVRRHWSGVTGAYAHSGKWVDPLWESDDSVSPHDYLRAAQHWVEMGAQIIGGCCAIGPEHIRLLRERLASPRIRPAAP
jgi:S-methylmethionine-dependent homocysteine/selenocysteine methylase